jgi:hypothetical protein
LGTYQYNTVSLLPLSIQDIRTAINTKVLKWNGSHGNADFVNSHYIDMKLAELTMQTDNLGFICSAIIHDMARDSINKKAGVKKDKSDTSDVNDSMHEEMIASLPLNLAFVMLAGYIISKSPSDTDYDKLSGSKQQKRRKSSSAQEGTELNKQVKSYSFSIERLLSVFIVLMEAENKSKYTSSSQLHIHPFISQAKFFAEVSFMLLE